MSDVEIRVRGQERGRRERRERGEENRRWDGEGDEKGKKEMKNKKR